MKIECAHDEVTKTTACDVAAACCCTGRVDYAELPDGRLVNDNSTIPPIARET